MNLSKRFLLSGMPGLLMLLALTTSAQWDKKKPAEWSEKDAVKVLNDSPWGRTQVYTSPVEMFRTGDSSRPGGTARPGSSQGQAQTNLPPNATHVNFRVRFFSAKPIRLAMSRLMELKQKEMNQDLAAALKNLTSGEFLEYIVITVTVDSSEPGSNAQQALGVLMAKGTADLKNDSFLEIKGGKRIFIQEYQRPKKDGVGARFIFQRLVDGNPFITEQSEEIHFYAPLSDSYKLDRRFKIKEMMYEGKLEY